MYGKIPSDKASRKESIMNALEKISVGVILPRSYRWMLSTFATCLISGSV